MFRSHYYQDSLDLGHFLAITGFANTVENKCPLTPEGNCSGRRRTLYLASRNSPRSKKDPIAVRMIESAKPVEFIAYWEKIGSRADLSSCGETFKGNWATRYLSGWNTRPF